MIEPTQGDLEEYFDTPAHALFAANRITNFDAFGSLSAELITRLEKHADLFGQGAPSDALAISLMRASTRAGAPEMTLRYANRVPSGAALRATAEYNWLVGIALFQQQEYAGAESALIRVINSKDADVRERMYAQRGLVGVYAKLNRPVDQLRAAVQASVFGEDPSLSTRHLFELENASLLGFDFDTGYLLDVQLTDSELDEYLNRYSNAPDGPFSSYPRKLSALEVVRYARAVRYARHEEYSEAEQIYDHLNPTRSTRMRQAAKLFQNVKDSAGQKERQLEASYEYAVFLSNNEDRIFFNDTCGAGSRLGPL